MRVIRRCSSSTSSSLHPLRLCSSKARREARRRRPRRARSGSAVPLSLRSPGSGVVHQAGPCAGPGGGTRSRCPGPCWRSRSVGLTGRPEQGRGAQKEPGSSWFRCVGGTGDDAHHGVQHPGGDNRAMRSSNNLHNRNHITTPSCPLRGNKDFHSGKLDLHSLYDHSRHDDNPRRAAGGRIDAAEAARRIDALKAAESGDLPGGSGLVEAPDLRAGGRLRADRRRARNRPPRSTPTPGRPRPDRPQHATHTSESFAPPPTRSAPSPEPSAEPVRPSRSTPAASSGSRSVPSAAESESLARRRLPPVPPTVRTCCAATGVLEVSSEVSLAPPGRVQHPARRAAGRWTTSAPSGWARSCLLKVNPASCRRRGDRRQPQHRAGSAPRQGPGHGRRGQVARRARSTTP